MQTLGEFWLENKQCYAITNFTHILVLIATSVVSIYVMAGEFATSICNDPNDDHYNIKLKTAICVAFILHVYDIFRLVFMIVSNQNNRR